MPRRRDLREEIDELFADLWQVSRLGGLRRGFRPQLDCFLTEDPPAFTVIVGCFVGIIAGYRGGWVDSLLSRASEIFLAIPLLLGGILFLYVFPNDVDSSYLVVVGKVALVLGVLGWPTITRLQRGAVLQVKPNDYVQAARALGASPTRVIISHILPNSIASDASRFECSQTYPQPVLAPAMAICARQIPRKAAKNRHFPFWPI